MPGFPPCHGLPRARCACRAAAPSSPGHPSRTNTSDRTPSRGTTVANFRYKRAQMNPLHCPFVGTEKFHLLHVQNPERVLPFCRFSVCEKSTFSTLKPNSYKTKKVWRKWFALLTSPIKYLSENVYQNSASARLAPLPRLAPNEVCPAHLAVAQHPDPRSPLDRSPSRWTTAPKFLWEPRGKITLQCVFVRTRISQLLPC